MDSPSPSCTQCGLPAPHHSHDDAEVFCCYGCRLLYRLTGESGEEGEAQGLLLRLGVGIFLAMNVMVFSLASYSGYIYGDESADGVLIFRGVAFLLATPVLFLLGLPLIYAATNRRGIQVVSIDALIGLGVMAAYGISVYNTIQGGGHAYYDTASGLLVLLTLGRYLEARSKAAATAQWTTIAETEQDVRVVGERLEVKAASAVRVGDVLRLSAGDRVPVDGRVTRGESGVDTSALTGESEPAFVTVADRVAAGSILVDGGLDLEATTDSANGAIGRLRAMLEEARANKSPSERLAESAARVFIPVVIGLAACTFFGWSLLGDVETAILAAVSVLVVACPCALGIAAPAAIWTALGRAAGGGVLIRSGEALEAAGRLEKVFLDKTGTVTTGAPRLGEVVSLVNGASSPDRLLSIAEGLERATNHPIGRSLVLAAEEKGVTGQVPESVRTYPGLGLSGTDSEGRHVYLGSERLMAREGLDMNEGSRAACVERYGKGESLIYLGWDGEIKGMFAMYESVRPDAGSAVGRLKAMGLDVELLTGDRFEAAQRTAHSVGDIRFRAALMPEDKIEAVRKAPEASAMVGDGLNDAPAIAAADVGIAVGNGTDLSRASASVNLLRDDLNLIPATIDLAIRTRRTIRQNFAWAAGYNSVGVLLAAFGMLNPIVAALAMVFSSLFVVWNSRRLEMV